MDKKNGKKNYYINLFTCCDGNSKRRWQVSIDKNKSIKVDIVAGILIDKNK